MSTDVAYSAVRTFLEANWTATPLRWENETFAMPDPPAPWVAVEISGNTIDQMSIGAGDRGDERWQEEGTVWFHVMVPSGSGSLLARQHATALTNLFKGLELDPDIEFRSLSVGLGEPGDDDGNWWRISASADWIRG